MKRVLFFSCWCRKRANHASSPVEDDLGVFPLTIGSSFTPPSGFVGSAPSPVRTPRQRLNPRINGKSARKSRPNPKDGPTKGDASSTIPIRAPETPRHSRLASSAPSMFSTPSPRTSQAALAKMTKGGFKPRQTPARVLLNAAAASSKASSSLVTQTGPGPARTTSAIGSSTSDRVRKERSESATPGPGSLLLDGVVTGSTDVGKESNGKRVKV